MITLNYPIRFEPILKEKVWGGDRLMSMLDKKSIGDNTGESWEISDVESDMSVVTNGSMKGKTLSYLLKTYREQLVGKHVYRRFRDKFPLLIKFIDAKEPLSIQVHPDDDLALKHHNSFGKTEMWYVVHAEKDGHLIVGFKRDTDEGEYLRHLKNDTLKSILNDDKVSQGDVYFIPAGRVHAIGGGVLLAEIQQTSDVTYRIYDWNRPDKDGNFRELHTDFAVNAIDYKAETCYKSSYTPKEDQPVELVNCNYFTTNKLVLNNKTYTVTNDKDSFLIYMCVKGGCTLSYGDEGQTIYLQRGQTILVPATLEEFTIDPDTKATLLEVFIKKSDDGENSFKS